MTGTHTGTCFCGAIGLIVRGHPLDMGHCTSCRTYSGAPLVAFTIWPAEHVEITHGIEVLGSFNKVGTSDRKYCRMCGGHLLIDHPHLGVIDVRAAVLPTVRFEPKAHINYAEMVLPIQDGLPKFKDLPVEIGGTGTLVPE